MSRRPLAAFPLTITLAWATPAAAQRPPTVYDNAQSVPIGSRAAGMGGAYTALACDEGALHYNPASLSCAASSHLELSANAYILQGMRARGALGAGEDISATTFHSIPSIVGAVRVLREGTARTGFDTYPKRLTFGFTVSVPRTVALKVDPPRPDERNYASSSTREDITIGDIGLGYQFNRELSVGLAIGAALRTSEQHSSWLLVRGSGAPCDQGACSDYLAYAEDRSALAVGVHAKLGVLFRPIKNFSFGLSISTPTIHVYGSAKQSATLTRAEQSGYAALPTRSKGSSDVGLPPRVALGIAYVRRRYTFSCDLSLHLPHKVRLAYDMKAQQINGLEAPQPIPDLTISPGAQPNINLGASVPFGPLKELDIGFFTDLSSVSKEDVEKLGMNRVHMFGGSMTLGLLGKQSRAWIGLAAEIGHTTTKVPGRGFTYERIIELPPGALPEDGDSTLVRWTMTGILGSNYSFRE